MNYDDKAEKVTPSVMELSMGQKFELEKMNRAIDGCDNLEELKSLTKTLTSAWMTQKAAIAWMIRQHLDEMQRLS
jgi:hypothetical protein